MKDQAPLDVVRRALPGLHVLLEEVRRVRRDADNGDVVAYEEYFPLVLTRLYRAILMALEAAQLREARSALVKDWNAATKQGVGHMEQEEYHDGSFSPPLVVLYGALEEMKAVAGDGLDPVDDYNLRRFEELLRRTAELVHRRNATPSSERDVQHIMDDYLRAAFVDYTPQVHVPGVLKNFIPDGGVHSLKAAVEFKYATNAQDVRVALSGVLEDTAGYRGSSDWIRFYSVVYMTGPYESEACFAADLRRVQATSWTPILVNGSAVSAKRSARSAMTAKRRKGRRR